MKRFILAVVSCASILTVLSILLFPVAQAAENPLLALLNLPAPPPPNPQVTLQTNSYAENFLSKRNPPPDNAPIDVLMDYWSSQSQNYRGNIQYQIYPSDKVLERLMREIEKEPARLGEFLGILPTTERSSNFVKEIYDKSSGGTEAEREQRGSLKSWLKYHSPYFSSELAREAARVSDVDDYVTNHRELIALSRVDWDRAEPIVSRLYNTPGQKASKTAALWALYVHAIASGSSDIDRYRDELKDIVADRSLGAGVRDLALDALSLEKEWSGRDEWYVSMMQDETLTDLGNYTGLTTLISNSPEEKYVDRMIELLDSNNITVRTAAAQNLLTRLDADRERIVKALVRWIEDPKWLKTTARAGRVVVVQSLSQIRSPESVPGLIAALDEKSPASPARFGAMSNMNANRPSAVIAMAANAAARAATSANTASVAANSVVDFGSYYELRHAAIEALAFQKDSRAAPALRRILNENTNAYENIQLVKALYECGGFAIGEQVSAVEKMAKEVQEESAGAAKLRRTSVVGNIAVDESAEDTGSFRELTVYDHQGLPSTDVSRLLGVLLVNSDSVSDELAVAIVERITSLDRTDPYLANAFRRIVIRWQGTAVNALLLRDLKNSKASDDAIVRLLALRKQLREKQPQDVFDLRTGSQSAIGISSCLLEDPNDQESILSGINDEAKTALLACARLIRASLPVQKVAENLSSKDKLLAHAAERYLETEDSPESRSIVLSLHPNEARILGATTAFYPGPSGGRYLSPFTQLLFASVSDYHAKARPNYGGYGGSETVEIETRLQDEVKRTPELLGVYSWDQNFIRVYKDQAVLSWESDPARYRERILTKEEFDNFKGLLSHFKAADLPPFLECLAAEGCETRELLMLGRNGGRRLFAKVSTMPPLFSELDRMFEEMRRAPSTIKYWASKDIPGLELLFAGDELDAKAVWKKGGDFRLLTEDKARRAAIDAEIDAFGENLPEDEGEVVPEFGEDVRVSNEKARRQYENFGWYNFSAGTLGDVAAQPVDIEYVPLKDQLTVPPSSERWKARTAVVEIRADDEGLYKIVTGRLTKIKDGYYRNPVITPNGRWVVVTHYDEEKGTQLVRVNLVTNKEFVVQSDERPVFRAISFIPSIGRVLVASFESTYDDEIDSAPGESNGSGCLLLDPETGTLIPARGEVRPLLQQTYRPLQPAANAFEFWAAIPTETETVIGLYNTRNFNIKPLVRLPKLRFDSMNMWTDDEAGKVFFVYEGHLLSVPIKVR
jgi:hypothetical protein